jgi:hypothetical protein
MQMRLKVEYPNTTFEFNKVYNTAGTYNLTVTAGEVSKSMTITVKKYSTNHLLDYFSQ